MTNEPEKERLLALEERISKVRQAQEKPGRLAGAKGEYVSQAQQAWRMMIELIVGIGMGVGIGYGLDVLFGTTPWLLMLFTLLGFATGVNLMLKTVKELQKDNAAPKAASNEAEGDHL